MPEEHVSVLVIALVLAVVTMIGVFKLRNSGRRGPLREKIRNFVGFILTEAVVAYLLIQLFAT